MVDPEAQEEDPTVVSGESRGDHESGESAEISKIVEDQTAQEVDIFLICLSSSVRSVQLKRNVRNWIDHCSGSHSLCTWFIFYSEKKKCERSDLLIYICTFLFYSFFRRLRAVMLLKSLQLLKHTQCKRLESASYHFFIKFYVRKVEILHLVFLSFN